MTTASTGMTVACVAMLESRFEKISMPPVFCSKPISTVTPQTMRIVPHGMRLIASPSSAARSSDSSTAPAKAAKPMLKPLEDDHAEDQQRDHGERSDLMPIEALRGLRLDLDAVGAHQQLQAAEHEIARERHDRVRQQVVGPRLQLEARQPDALHEPASR